LHPKAAVERTFATFGQLDVLLNNAGALTGVGRVAAIIVAQTTAEDLL